MKTVNIHEAKTQLSQLLRLVQAGESVVIAKYGEPIAELRPHQKRVAVEFGRLRGKIKYRDADLVGPDADIERLFTGK